MFKEVYGFLGLPNTRAQNAREESLTMRTEDHRVVNLACIMYPGCISKTQIPVYLKNSQSYPRLLNYLITKIRLTGG